MKGMRVMQAKKVSGSAKGKMASSAVLHSTKVQTFIGMFELLRLIRHKGIQGLSANGACSEALP